MKKRTLTLLILGIAACALAFTGCQSKKADYTFYMPDGAPLLAVLEMRSSGDKIGGKTVDYKVEAPDNIGPILLAGTPDIAIAPINACAVNYNNGNGYRLAAVTSGINNIMVRGGGGDFALTDLLGEILYVFNINMTPGLTVKALLDMYEIPYNDKLAAGARPAADEVGLVNLQAMSDVQQALITGKIIGVDENVKYGLLAEPAATAVALNTAAGEAPVTVALDVQAAWAAKTGGSYPQAGLVVKESIIAGGKAFVGALLTRFAASQRYAYEKVDETIELVKSSGSTGLSNHAAVKQFLQTSGAAAFAYKPLSAAAVRTEVTDYLTVLANGNATLIGGKMPDTDFYYVG